MTVDPVPNQGPRPSQTADYESDIDNDDELLSSVSDTAGLDDEDHVKVKFNQDIEDALSFVQSLASRKPTKEEKSQQLLEFVDSRKMEWHKTTREGQNFLHVLADCNSSRKSVTSLQWLMSRALLRLPHLIGSMDKKNRTPLTAALLNKNEAFSYAACLNLKPGTRQRFKEPLESECENQGSDRGATCLHTALTCEFNKEDLRQDIVKVMCSFVPDKMFTVKDHMRRTPLHLAVEYDRCCNAQVGIVEELLRWGPQALDIPYQASLSVYQYHVRTQREAEARIQQLKEENKKKANQGKPRKEDENETRTSSNTKKPISRSERTSMGPPPLPKDRDRDRDRTEPKVGIARSHTGATSQEKSGSYAIAANQERSTSSYATVYAKERPTPLPSPSLHPVGSSKTSAYSSAPRHDATDPVSPEMEKERQDAAANISLQLKHLYLRTQKPENAARCLNVGGLGKELWFDFGPPKKLTMADFKIHFRHLQFDTILQYVAFPQIELDDHKQIPDRRYAGKEDMTFLFDWLKQQGVSRIIKVIVDDLKSPSHSDAAIEKALKPFNVEILDWRRLDLDPVSLSEVGQSLREVTLHWSGRNTVLRAWSEKEGLALIPTLEVVNLVQTEGLESSQRTRQNLDTFEKRLHESWPNDRKPKVNRPKTGGGRTLVRGLSVETLSDRQERSVDPHKWMQCMENFAKHFRQIPALRDKITDPSLEPVEVALIDDGADITRPDLSDLKGKKFPGKSFCYYQDGSTWRVSPYWDSSSGHGTLMARLIRKICPSAVIHVIKLQTFDVENSNKLQINPDSAIKAIEYAAERGSQIICMSWTIKPPEGDNKKEFDNAIHHALNSKGVLMFCAASDQGKSADLTYPHGSNRGSFRIGAAKATGSMSDTVGDAHDLDFIFPGHQVVVNSSDDVYDKDLQKFEAHSGSSVANALAAGLSALVIECVRLGVFYTNETKQSDPTSAIRKDDLIKIRDRNQMKYALSWIGTNRNTDNKYIEVWDTFNAVAEKLRQNEGSRIDRLENIATLARFFLKKGVNYGE
ncbi:hypothetical protein CEP54_011046 [Fusarium duplospermum]|uniref:Peptidase S8/S53 domain-containing protein n=1 Tax=Fusarium duplospermum TaxID=1325734 RepID=A0A428PGJ5_9HYPO|nr:hypothetical protein CEP54_011046 [Fusarium duplospermum]